MASASDVFHSGRRGEKLGSQSARGRFAFNNEKAHRANVSVFAEFEREILSERVRAGLAEARLKGQRLGRPTTAARKAAEVRKLFRQGISKSEIARRLAIGRTSVRRILSQK